MKHPDGTVRPITLTGCRHAWPSAGDAVVRGLAKAIEEDRLQLVWHRRSGDGDKSAWSWFVVEALRRWSAS